MDASERLEERTARLAAATERLARTALLVGLPPALVLGALVALVHPVAGVAVALVLGAVWVLLVRRRTQSAADVAFEGLATRPLAPGEAPRLRNVLEGLCLTCGVEDPSVEVVETGAGAGDSLNAGVAVAGGGVRLVVTPSVLVDLDRMQLEGLLANLLGRVRDGSGAYATLVVALLGSGARAQRLLDEAIGDQRAVRADLVAVDLTRYPPGLRAALEAMDLRGTSVPGAPARSAPCWLAPPAAGTDATDARPAGDESGGVQPLELRIAVLAEL